jgi:hypothetical protein
MRVGLICVKSLMPSSAMSREISVESSSIASRTGLAALPPQTERAAQEGQIGAQRISWMPQFFAVRASPAVRSHLTTSGCRGSVLSFHSRSAVSSRHARRAPLPAALDDRGAPQATIRV